MSACAKKGYERQMKPLGRGHKYSASCSNTSRGSIGDIMLNGRKAWKHIGQTNVRAFENHKTTDLHSAMINQKRHWQFAG